MGTKSKATKIFHKIIEEIDLYFVALAAALATFAHLFHLTNQTIVLSLLLATISIIAVGMLRDRSKARELREQLIPISMAMAKADFSTASGTKWYLRRRESEKDFLSDLRRAEKVVFVGVSHNTLTKYLSDVIEGYTNDRDDKSLPWRELVIVYASSEVGLLHESEQFLKNMQQSRIKIGQTLTDPKYRNKLGNLTNIQFLQAKAFIGYTGSMFFHRRNAHTSLDD